MNELADALVAAARLIASHDPALVQIVALSLKVSIAAVAIASLIGLPLGATLAVYRFPGRSAFVITLNSLMGLPPVVAGLLVYLLLSRSGPLGSLGILFTPTAMIVVQVVLITPIIAALTRQVGEDLWRQFRDLFLLDGVGYLRAAAMLLQLGRLSLITALLAGLGRALAEVGAVLIVGGNIAGETRTMTTAIALETSRGDLPLALGLGAILLALTLFLNIVMHGVSATIRPGAG